MIRIKKLNFFRFPYKKLTDRFFDTPGWNLVTNNENMKNVFIHNNLWKTTTICDKFENQLITLN